MNHPARKDFGDAFGTPPCREASEIEAKRDIEKPIWQLICDVHEEIMDNRLDRPVPNGMHRNAEVNLNLALRRIASLMGRVAWEHERVNKRIMWLNVFIFILTLVLVWLAIVETLHRY